LLIDPTDGFIQGTPTETGTFEMQIFAVDGEGVESRLTNVVFDVWGGPNNMPCLNSGTIVDDGSASFTCDCTNIAFEGDNCEVDSLKRAAEAKAVLKTQEALPSAQGAADSAQATLDAVAEADTAAAQAQAEADTAAAQAQAEADTAAAQTSAAEESKLTSRIAGAAAGGVIALILLVLGAMKYRQHRISLRPVDFKALFDQLMASGEISNEQVTGLQLSQAASGVKVSNLPREIHRSCVVKSDKIGEGAFGEVFKAVLDESKHGGVPGYLVACKSVTDPSGEGAQDLLQEATIMGQVGMHDNLVSLIGVVTSGTPLLNVIAVCEHGSLKSHLEKRTLGEGKLAAKPGALPPKIDADIAWEIARGMMHLAEHQSPRPP
jgi:hypothetical protein